MTDGDPVSGLQPLLAPRSIAIVGASSDPVRIGGRPISYMLAQKFAGTLLPVNPNRTELQGLKCYPSVAELPIAPDLGIIAVPATMAIETLDALGRRGTKAVILFSAGFGEVSEAGAEAQIALARCAGRYGMRLLGPNCLGVFNGAAGYYATHTGALQSGWPIPGRIGVISQSGAFATHIFTVARNRGIGTSFVVMTGNEADVTLGEVAAWMVGDKDIDVIAIYAEGFRDVGKLLAALAAAKAAKKPVIMMKVGRSRRGSDAAQSHTAAVAGDDLVVDAVLNEFGIIRAETTEALLDIAHLATRKVFPVGGGLGVVTVSGGGGVLISDAAEKVGLEMPDMPEPAQARLRELVPFCAPRNPVDCTAQAANDPTLIGQFAEIMVRDGAYGSVLAFMSLLGGWRAAVVKAQLAPLLWKYPDSLWVLSVVATKEQIVDYETEGFICIEDPTRAVVAIQAMHQLGEAFAAPEPARLTLPNIVVPATIANEVEAKEVLSSYGIQCVPEHLCSNEDEAARAAEMLGFPVVMKLVASGISHKSEIGGVVLNIGDAAMVRKTFGQLTANGAAFAIDGIIVSKQMDGLECMMGTHLDACFGPVAVFGLGGIFVEHFNDFALHRCPFGTAVAEQMIRSIRAAPLLLGARGRPAVDVSALARMLSALSAFAAVNATTVRSVDINPVIAKPVGHGAIAVDALIQMIER